MTCNAVDEKHVPKGREVKLNVNTSLHQQHAQQSEDAMRQLPPEALRTNLVVVFGQPLWYKAHDSVSCHYNAASILLDACIFKILTCLHHAKLCTRVEL